MKKIKEELTKFMGLSLQDIDQVNLMNRVDTKFLFHGFQFLDFLEDLAQFYNCLEVEGERIQSYQSLYFDDKRFTFFRDHHDQKNDRFKVRIRNYVNSNLYFLEVKHKQKKRTDKIRQKISQFTEEFDNEQQTFLDKALAKRKKLIPVLKNRFDRITFSGKNFPERLTIDMNIHFQWESHSINYENLVVAELKQSDLNRNSPFFQLMKKHQIRPLRISKYCIGLYLLYGQKQIKGNRFKQKIRILNNINTQNYELIRHVG